MLLRELRIRGAVCEPQFPRAGRTVFTEKSKERLIQQGPHGWYGELVALLRPLVAQDLYKVGRALTDLSGL